MRNMTVFNKDVVLGDGSTISINAHGAKHITPCIKSEDGPERKCQYCSKKVTNGNRFFKLGLKATTRAERRYAHKGCVWYICCDICSKPYEG